jgi:hypothetical protein
VRQLSCFKPSLPLREPIVRKFEELEDEAFDPRGLTLEESKELIISLTDGFPATIVIDALDECDPQKLYELLKALTEMLKISTGLLKIFVSSRDNADIRRLLETLPNLCIHAADNSEDIQRFIQLEVGQSIDDGRLLGGDVSLELRDLITKTLSDGADGMCVKPFYFHRSYHFAAG